VENTIKMALNCIEMIPCASNSKAYIELSPKKRPRNLYLAKVPVTNEDL